MGQASEMTGPNRLQLPRAPNCASMGRRWIEQESGDKLNEATLNNVKLVATELLNNAYLHGRGQIELGLAPQNECVRVEVIDEGQGIAVKIRQNGPGGGGGWGLRIVDQLATAWGAYEGTTHVWAEVPLTSY